METLIFNLNKKQKYKKTQKDCSIYCAHNYGPCVYASGFQSNQMKSIKFNPSINSYFDKGSEILPNVSSGEKNFNVKEVEIYKIIL